MSTTDRSVCHDKPCPCGKGFVKIISCSLDHPYARPSQDWYESALDCGECKNEYKIEQLDNNEGRFIVIKSHDDNSEPKILMKIDQFCNGLM